MIIWGAIDELLKILIGGAIGAVLAYSLLLLLSIMTRNREDIKMNKERSKNLNYNESALKRDETMTIEAAYDKMRELVDMLKKNGISFNLYGTTVAIKIKEVLDFSIHNEDVAITVVLYNDSKLFIRLIRHAWLINVALKTGTTNDLMSSVDLMYVGFHAEIMHLEDSRYLYITFS